MLPGTPEFRSPFFGPKPEALALFQVNIGTGDPLRALKAIRSHLVTSKTLRWQLGLGPAFYERYDTKGKLRRPRGLSPLTLNGDQEHGLTLGESESDLLITLSEDEWDGTIVAAKTFADHLEECGTEIKAIEFGNEGGTDRDHSGFIDGTSNLQELSPELFAKSVFIQEEDDMELAGGTFLVYRKYEEDLEMWNDLPDYVQEHFVGRKKSSGKFLNDEEVWSYNSSSRTPPTAHIQRVRFRDIELENPSYWMERIYRRGTKFTERRSDGSIRYGLLFIALVRDLHRQFVRIHNERMLPKDGTRDHLLSAGYIKPLRNACYFLPSGDGSSYFRFI